MIKNESIEATKKGFEASFAESEYYNKQTQDSKHLNDILSTINIKPGMKILDLGCGSGYLTFPIAERNPQSYITGLDIVTNTLKKNQDKKNALSLSNLDFIEYDGETFPFESDTFDLIISRYALHHFPQIENSMSEIARVLKTDGKLFISDPRPNDCDTTRFVDDYMQLKKDGHVKFYTKNEWVHICKECGMELEMSFDSEIRFPKKKDTAYGFAEVIARHDKVIIDSYDLVVADEEIWVTEQVNNLLFKKHI